MEILQHLLPYRLQGCPAVIRVSTWITLFQEIELIFISFKAETMILKLNETTLN